MRTVEVEGSSRVDATEKALDLLGADIDDVKVEVLKEERRGLLGYLGFRKVTVRVTLVEENIVEIAASFINHISAHIPVPFEAAVELKNNVVYVKITGKEIKEFQRKEDFAGSIETIVELMLNRRMKRSIRVRTDFVDDDKARKEDLMALARKMAEKAIRDKKPVSLKAMTAWERRIVHMAIERDERVFTESSGNKRNRHVVIYPKGYQGKEKPTKAASSGGKKGQSRSSGKRRKGKRRPGSGKGKDGENKPKEQKKPDGQNKGEPSKKQT